MSDNVLCPRCKKPFSDLWELEIDDGDVWEGECGWCGAPMSITVCVTWDYSLVEKSVDEAGVL